MIARLRKIARSLRLPVPLLAKELLEQSARRRTYVIRAVYAVALFLIFCLMLGDRMRYADASSMLGSGRMFFESLLILEFGGLFLFLPAMMSSVVTYEKERESLSLLFLTRLGPWEIIFQKYLGRLIPMFTFLLLGMPLLAVAYAYGGVETQNLWAGIWCLFLAALQVGAFSVMVSAWCRTTVSAFIGSYLFGAAFYSLPLLAILPLIILVLGRDSSPSDGTFLLSYNPAVLIAITMDGALKNTSPAGFALYSLPSLATTLIFLALAKRFLVTRAFLPPRHRLLSLFKKQDTFWKSVNSWFGGVVLVKDGPPLPQDEPVAWREVTKRPLGKLNYLLRLTMIVEIPLVLIFTVMIGGGLSNMDAEFYWSLYFVLWGAAILTIVARASTTVAAERASQTLDALLTTPMTGEEIVRQKMAGVRRMVLVFTLPFLTTFVVAAYVGTYRYDRWNGWFYFTVMAATLFVYLPMFAWFAMWVGLRARNRYRAIITALVSVVLWIALPFVALVFLEEFCHISMTHWPESWGMLLSPAGIVAIMENKREFGGNVFEAPLWFVAAFNLLWHGFLLYWFRSRCIINADRCLGRLPPFGRVAPDGRAEPAAEGDIAT